MRPALHPVLPVLLLAALSGPATTARAIPADGNAALTRLDRDFREGRIDRETRLVQTFRYAFAPERLDAPYVPDEATPLRCLTAAIAEYHAGIADWSRATREEIEGYLRRPVSLERSTYISPGGKFSFNYFTTGANAVPANDSNPPNGVPDYVERCAEYMDTSWDTEITALGFVAPLLPLDNTYDVGFQSMGAYGYTAPAGLTTEIVLHNNFIGFPSNTDPDGNQLGAAKVTCAHEFKHASNYTANGWLGWEEINATWAEDIVFPLTNDYWNYVNNSGPNVLGQPWTSLDSGGEGSYEDCLWEHYLSTTYGTGFLVDVAHQLSLGYNQKRSYAESMALYGTNWADSYASFLEWTWFTGIRAEPSFGFPDAPNLRLVNLRGSTSSYPFFRSDNVATLASHPFLLNPGLATGSARIQVNADNAYTPDLVVSVIWKPTGGGATTIVRPPLDANNDCDYQVPVPFSALSYVTVYVTNSKRTGSAASYTLDVTDEPLSTGVDLPLAAATDVLRLDGVSPNPFAADTRIRFSAPREDHATVRILDVQGRVVRTLLDGTVAAGGNELTWDGRDAAGQRLATGVYWAQVRAGNTSVVGKVTLLR